MVPSSGYLLNEAKQDVKNYADRGGCYPSRLKSEVENILRDLHNSSHPTEAQFNDCSIIYSKYFKVFNKLTFSQTFFKTLAYFSVRFQHINRCFSLQLLIKKQITPFERYILRILAFFPFSQLEIQLFRLRIAVNAIFFFSSLRNKLLGCHPWKRV